MDRGVGWTLAVRESRNLCWSQLVWVSDGYHHGLYLSVRLRISMGSSSNESGAAARCGVVDSSSSFFTKTSPSAASSSSGTMFALRGSSMSDTGGPCSVLARLRDSGLLGAASSRVKEREGCRLLGRAAILVIAYESDWTHVS
jgi:hypothetical protein